MAEIECRGLSKRYGVVEVVPHFDLTVADHEFVVFLGPSGCGKSTILRMIAGLEEITGGQLSIDGTVVNDVEPGDRGVSMVFQNYALYPHMTIRENITFGLKRQHVPASEINRRLDAVVATLGLSPVIDRKPTELSGGQQQRVAIARAMIKTPKVFLFDEPLSNLDAKLRSHMRVEIARLHKTLKTTTVYVTHDQLEAMTLADRIVLLDAGRIEQVGSPEEIYDNPRTLFVAGFIGTPAMNLLPMTITSTASGIALKGTGLDVVIAVEAGNLHAGQQVVLGIRPADVTVRRPDGPAIEVSGRTELIEFNGDQVLVTADCSGDRISALIPARLRPLEGDRITFFLDSSRIYLFDTRSGLQLTRGGASNEGLGSTNRNMSA